MSDSNLEPGKNNFAFPFPTRADATPAGLATDLQRRVVINDPESHFVWQIKQKFNFRFAPPLQNELHTHATTSTTKKSTVLSPFCKLPICRDYIWPEQRQQVNWLPFRYTDRQSAPLKARHSGHIFWRQFGKVQQQTNSNHFLEIAFHRFAQM